MTLAKEQSLFGLTESRRLYPLYIMRKVMNALGAIGNLIRQTKPKILEMAYPYNGQNDIL